MKQTIRGKILVFVVIPFLVIYLALSAFISRQVFQAKSNEVKQQLRILTKLSEHNLKNFFEIARLTVEIMVSEFESIDPHTPGARKIGEGLLAAHFRSPYVASNFLVYEPDAFDGRDAVHTGDYPGAPSGRYVRSYIRRDNAVEEFPGLNEKVFSDPALCYWYTIPRHTGGIFIDLGGRFGFLRDNAVGGAGSSILLSAPLKQDDRFVGVVGLHARITEDILGEKLINGSEIAVFLSNGRLAYSPGAPRGDLSKTLEELGFSQAAGIHAAMERGESILIEDSSALLSEKSYNYFRPVFMGSEYLYLFYAIPRSYAWLAAAQSLVPIAVSLLVSLISFSLLLFYMSRGISRPLKRLAETAEAIVAGNLGLRIEIPRSKDELGLMTRSLSRMAEQFRVGRLVQERLHERLDLFMGIHGAMFKSESLKAAFDAVLDTVSAYFGISRGRLVFIVENKAVVFSCYPRGGEETGIEFIHHRQIAALLENRRHLTMNRGAAAELKLPLDSREFGIQALCILPLRKKESLAGYIIMEGSNEKAFFYDDTTVLFIADVLSYLLISRSDWAALPPAENAAGNTAAREQVRAETLDVFRSITGLDIDKGLEFIGGEAEDYLKLLHLTIKVISEGIEKMRASLDELPAFAIAVHGMKGALYNIGAGGLGDEAKELELAAKSGDSGFCRARFSAFEEQLAFLAQNLAGCFSQIKSGAPSAGKTELSCSVKAELTVALQKAREACGQYNLDAVTHALKRFVDLEWEDASVTDALRNIAGDLENIEYDTAVKQMDALIARMERGE
ncbi:MAG: HAMP domain-containing protein [Treponema sp.]|jgi:HPt (histidine-containing phosphotransfer) domain-containing protein/HAMP domain-containing protein|nr:HAMP domain-containing protein [Treponema sp.]